MARPRVIKDCEDLETHIDSFIALCSSNTDIRPTDYQLTKYLDISVDTLERYTRESDKYPGYAEALKKLYAYREDRLITMMEDKPGLSTPCIIQLKQPHNGGYVDRPASDTGPQVIKVEFTGLGGPDAGK